MPDNLPEIMPKGTLTDSEKDKVVEEIVVKWNEMVVTIQNTTINLCSMIKDMLNKYPKDTIKDIVDKVKRHPEIKGFVSIERIWQGMRLIERKPQLLEFSKKTEKERGEIEYKEKPYLKKDGEIFWEFYFEIQKSPLNDLEKEMLEVEGKKELWSYRALKDKIQERRDELELPTLDIARRQEKKEMIRTVVGILKDMPLEKIRDAIRLLTALKKQKLHLLNEKSEEGKE